MISTHACDPSGSNCLEHRWTHTDESSPSNSNSTHGIRPTRDRLLALNCDELHVHRIGIVGEIGMEMHADDGTLVHAYAIG